MEYPLSLYFDTEVVDVEVLDLCRGDDDYRKVYIASDGQRKLAIKHLSNTFSDERRIKGWFRLMDEYRKIGLYCPAVVPNRNGELLHCHAVGDRDYYVYAEEYSIYNTAERVGREKYEDALGHDSFTPDLMRSLGIVASSGFDVLDWPSAYCLLEPFCSPDTTDEATESAIAFVNYVEKNLPPYSSRAKDLLILFYRCQEDLRAIYSSLPTSCFQADLNRSNVLLNEENRFVGLIDFNLCGREPILNYTVREALWGVSDCRLFGEDDSRLYFYDKDLDDLRVELFLENIRYIQETYSFTSQERMAFPVLFRYMNSFWWHHLNEIQRIKEDDNKVKCLLDWLERQMTRDDIQLP